MSLTLRFQNTWLQYLGIYGLSPSENKLALRLDKYFSYIMILAAIGLLYEWQHARTSHHHDQTFFYLLDWTIWVFFLSQFLILLKTTTNKPLFLKQQWIILLIVILGIPILFRNTMKSELLLNLRPLLSLFILIRTARIIIVFFIDGQLYTTILAAAVIVLIFGISVAGIDSNIDNAWDGIWWAIATVSTVGYGDIVPQSLFGRIIGCLLVIVGIGVFVVLTANFLKILLHKESELIEQEEHDINDIKEQLDKMQQQQEKMNDLLKKYTQQK